jgi:exodeoxyribonuclease VII large subunit
VSLESRAERLVAEHGGTDALSITEFYRRVDRALRSSFPEALWISGEIRSMKVLPRGHCFIDLVDPANAQDSGAPTLNVKCWSTRWRSVRSTLDHLGIDLDAGMVVRVRGEVQFYKSRGTVDFILSELDTDALLGKVAAERARLIKALVDEDLFDTNRRISVPRLPLRVGLVASPSTEGYRDFMGCLEASGMAFAVRIVPTEVQGRNAPTSVASAIRRFRSEPCDIVVVVRGGGSKADLATFDSEPVARAIVGSTAPVWTGIGHTGDQSVADEVANRSFITPTECGQELARLATDFWRSGLEGGLVAVRLAREQLERAERLLESQRRGTAALARSQLDRHADRLVHRSHTLRSAVRVQVDAGARQLEARTGDLAKSSVRSVVTAQERVSVRARRLALLPDRHLAGEQLRLAQWQRLLGAYDYQRQLERGYSVTRDATGRVVRTAAAVDAGSLLFTRLSDGELVSKVTAAAEGPSARPERGPLHMKPANTTKGSHDGYDTGQ